MAVEMNMKLANGEKLTTNEVYTIKYDHKNKQISEIGTGKISKPVQNVIVKAPEDPGEMDDNLPNGKKLYSQKTSRGEFNSDYLDDEKNEFFLNIDNRVVLNKITITGATTFDANENFRHIGPWTHTTKNGTNSDLNTALNKYKEAGNVESVTITISLYSEIENTISKNLELIKKRYVDYISLKTGIAKDKIEVNATVKHGDQYSSTVVLDPKQKPISY